MPKRPRTIKDTENQQSYYQRHKEELRKSQKEYYERTKRERLECCKNYYQEHKDTILPRARKYWNDHKEQFSTQRKENYKLNRTKILEYNAIRHQKHWINLKTEVLTHYGNGKCACVRCGYDDIRALTIDHINGDGATHRRDVLAGKNIYVWLKQNNFPDNFQTLCMNCNWVKRSEQKEYTHR